ncbi:hypothetical protein [Acinetobacter ursingii]|uniref:hypothetical protein n=1 Tax=Acinetobacter ursingii TaxID=108980 RepID=UPI0021E25AE5|nr:hypothetical protein [Acinetobacter ursingii]UYF80226.1 hypothetical protein LSO59_06810 [Acinetobacter ursingii]
MKLEKLTRSQAAEYLCSLDTTKSVAQWFTYLNDNARDDRRRKQPKIEFSKDINGTSLYSRKDLNVYIELRKSLREEKAAKLVESEVEKIKKAFGTEDTNNQNKFGQCFGHKWQGASVNIIADNADTSPEAAAIQLIINHPLRASALSLQEAKELTQEFIDSISRLDKSFEPKVTQQVIKRRHMII